MANEYLTAYNKGRDDCADGKPFDCEYEDTELVEAYNDGYYDEYINIYGPLR